MTERFTAEQRLVQDGRPVEALIALAAQLADDPSDPDLIGLAGTTLFAALDQPAALAAWNTADKHACYRTLLLQADCAGAPPMLAAQAARAITSDTPGATATLVSELTPVLSELLAGSPDRTPGFDTLVVFLLAVRRFLGDVIAGEQLKELHLERFAQFTPQDLAIPYSVMFNADAFGVNRDEILAKYPAGDPAVLEDPALTPQHLLFLEWLAGRDYFTAPDNADLAAYLAARLPGDADAMAAARMLIVRHLRPDGRLSPDRLREFGLGDIDDLARQTAATRQGLPRGRAIRAGAAWLGQRPYQAVQSAWNRATHGLPLLNRAQRRVRVAICLSGQLRGYRTVLADWRRSLLANVDAEFFIHSWRGIGRSDAQPFRYVLPFAGTRFPEAYRQIAVAEGFPAMRARYPALFRALGEGAQADEETLRELYGTPHVVLEDDAADRFAGFSNQDKMHHKIHAADRMARAEGDFDLHIRLRPDLGIQLLGFDWRDLREACHARPLILAEKPPGLHWGNLMVGDQCAIASPATMAVYADTWQSFPRFAEAGLARFPKVLTGHVSLALAAWMHGIQMEKAPIRFGSLHEASPMPTPEIIAALEQDWRGDAADERLMSAARQDL